MLVPVSLDARIIKAASRRRLSKGAWVRWALEMALAEETKTEDPLARLAALGAPTGDVKKMLSEIGAGRR
jgi:hypothetical protein